LKNYNTYNLETKLKNKFCQTHYGLGFLEIPYNFKNKKFLYDKKINKFTSNVFYSGLRHINKKSRDMIIDYLLIKTVFRFSI